MSLQTPKPTHHTEDWSRSSFFDVNSEMVKDLNLQSDADSDDDINDNDKLTLDSTFYSVSNDIDQNIDTNISDNSIMNEIMQYMITKFNTLIRTGELPPTFMDKMRSNPEEILAFIQENHNTIGNELNDKLDPEVRPTLHDIIQNGIIPNAFHPHINITKSENIVKKIHTETVDNYTATDPAQIPQLQVVVISSPETEGIKSKDAKDNKIEELLATISEMKEKERAQQQQWQRQQQQQQELIQADMEFSISHSNVSVENEIKQRHRNEIEAVKNEYEILLNEMRRKNKEIERKHFESVHALQGMEKSKVALLSVFNAEMDRMRAEIKKYNCIKFHTNVYDATNLAMSM